VRTSCRADGLHVELFRGAVRITDEEKLVAVAIGAPTPSGGLASPAFLGGVGPIGNAPIVREVVEDWFRRLGPQAKARLDDASHRSAASVEAQVACAGR
jgi:hypothetical protein